MQLHKQQAWFWQRIQGDAQDDDKHVKADRLSATKRISIYQDMYFARLSDALHSDFPLTKKALGEKQFGMLVERCVNACPSTHFSLDHYAAQFPYLLTNDPSVSVAIAELAGLEWATNEAFLAPHASALTLEELQSAALQDNFVERRVVFSPAVRVLQHAHATLAWWEHLKTSASDILAPPQSPEVVLVWRSKDGISLRSLAPTEQEAFEHAQSGEPLGVIAEAFAAVDDAPQAFLEMLLLWTRDELISRLDSSEPS